MSKLYLSLVMHHHQPEGNFNNVIEDAYQSSYEKFANFLLDHPGFRVGLHYSGPLLRWFSRFHPEFIEKIKVLLNMCARSAITCNTEMKIYFQKRKANGDNGMSVMNIIRNKLIARIFAVVNRGTPYIDTLKFAA